MSVEFTLKGCRLSLARWGRLLERWVEARGLEPYEPPRFEGGEDDATAYLFAPGSIRGVVLRYHGGRVELRLSALASRLDWQMAFSLMRAALTKGGGQLVRESGEVYGPEDLGKEAASAEAARDFAASAGMIAAQLREGGELSFPAGSFAVPLRPALFRGFTPERAREVERALVRRVRELAGAFRASTLVLRGGVRVAAWALGPSIVDEVDYVVVEEANVPLDRLRELLGERAEALGDGKVLLPALDRRADRKLLARIRAAGIPDDELVPRGSVDQAPTSADVIERVARALVENMFLGNDPAVVTRSLEAAGMEPGLAQDLVLLLARVVVALLHEGRDPDALVDELVDEGLPAEQAAAALEGVGRALAERARAKQEGPASRRGKKVLRARKVEPSRRVLRAKKVQPGPEERDSAPRGRPSPPGKRRAPAPRRRRPR